MKNSIERCLGQSSKEFVVNGTIFDANGSGLGDVSITLKCDSGELKTATDYNGNYSIKYKSTNPCTIIFSKSGYKESAGTFRPQPVTTISLPLEKEEKSVTLNEVTVKGNRVIVNGNKTSYLPDAKQVESSHEGIDLLFRLAIPQLDVNPMTGSVNSVDKSNVGFYIENRKVSLTEIGQLRAKDIKRVEFYENAVDKFPGEQKVLNYVLNHYEAGGYVDVSTDSRFIDRLGNYNVQIGLDSKKVNYVLLGGFSHSKDDGIKTDKEENVNLDNPFVRTTNPISGISKHRSYNALFRTTYYTEETTLFGQVGFQTNKTPESNILSSMEYNPSLFPSSDTRSASDSRNSTFSATAFLKHKFNDKNSLDWQIAYNYSDNNYHRLYNESGMDASIANSSKEYHNNLDTRLNYLLKLNKNNSLGLFVWEVYSKSKSRYFTSDNVDKQDLWSNEFLLYPTYQTLIANKVSINVQAGFDVSSYRANDNKRTTKVWPRPVFTLSWDMSAHNRFFLDARMGSSYPTMNTYTEARQQVNYYEVLQGNPLLGTTRLLDIMASHSLIESNFQFSSYVGYSQSINVLKNDYFAEGQTLVHSYETNGDYYGVDAGVNATLFLLKRNLQLKGGVAFHHQSLTGDNAAHYNKVSYNIDLFYYYKKFNFYTFFRPAQKYLFSTPQIVRVCPSYGSALGWADHGWKAEVGARNFFTRSKPYHEYYDFKAYSYNQYYHSDNFGPQIYVKLSYSFDFGRKVKHEEIQQNNTPHSAILHP